jgi:hypothetical protein
MDERQKKEIKAKVALQSTGNPDDIAKAIRYLIIN